MGMQHGQIPNEGGYNPYMAAGMGQGMMGQSGFPQAPSGATSMVSAQSQQMPMGSISGGADLKAFDAGKMKAGRLGHYGYLEGRGQLASLPFSGEDAKHAIYEGYSAAVLCPSTPRAQGRS